MFSALCQLLFSPDLIGLGVYGAVRAWNRNAANVEPRPYDWRNRTEDPVYKNNLQRLIDRTREFEEARRPATRRTG
jgi:hypothetical protein